MSADVPSEHLTGLSYSVWEQDAHVIETVVSNSERTGLLDRSHLHRTADVGAALADEISVVDDVCELSDADAKIELVNIRSKLEEMQRRVLGAESRMRRFLRR